MEQLTLYGLNDKKEIIESIVKGLNIAHCEFDVKLILTEALTNAFKHGNKEDTSKPIVIEYECINNYLKIKVKDSGENNSNINIPNCISDDDILNSSGRGLFIINSLANKVEYSCNTLTILKEI